MLLKDTNQYKPLYELDIT